MKRKTFATLVAALCLAVMGFVATPAYAATSGDEIIGWKKATIGVYDEAGRIVFQPYTRSIDGVSAAHLNANALNRLLSGNKQKTVVIPSGTTVSIDYTVRIGSNTTLIADGATIIQKVDNCGTLSNALTKTGYKSVQNVRIQGGTWKNAVNKKGVTAMRFAHGSNIVIDGATVITNYGGHAVELIAMKNVTVQNCVLKAEGKKNKKSVEEALQIDVATPKTAPGVYKEGGKKFTNGATCSNIKVLNNTIVGSRGVCANYASKEAKYKNKFHDKITIVGNKITGQSAEGLALFNTLNCTVKNNVIVTKSTRKSESYSVGMRVTAMGKSSKAKKAKIVIQGNTIKGAKSGLAITSQAGSKYKQATVKGNKISAKSGKKNALAIEKKAVKKVVNSKNKLSK